MEATPTGKLARIVEAYRVAYAWSGKWMPRSALWFEGLTPNFLEIIARAMRARPPHLDEGSAAFGVHPCLIWGYYSRREAVGRKRGTMKLAFTAVIAIAFGAGSMLLAQDMVEYSNIASKPPVGLQGLSNKINSAMEKTASASEKTGAKPGVQEITTSNSAKPLAKPTPPAIFVLSDGKRIESSQYLLTASNVVLQDGTAQRTIPLSAINVKDTEAENQKRGVNLKIPTSGSQITLSF